MTDWADGRPREAIEWLLRFVGEDPTREGLRDTPERALRAWRERTTGYDQDPKLILSTVFEEAATGMIVLRDVAFASTCEHHLLPFTGTATVGYVPNGRVVGLSKLARLVECFALRLQIQERMTRQIAEAVWEHVAPAGAGVVVRASHTCMSLRGIRKEAPLVTSTVLGVMADDPGVRADFLTLAS